jgi:hypothetical protein
MTPTPTTNNAEEFEVVDQRNPQPNWWVRTGTALTDYAVSTFTGGLSTRHPWNFVEGAAYRWLYKPDLQAARILYAAVAAHKLDGTPVWPMIVAPPGSVKTELLNALDGLPLMHILDSLTAVCCQNPTRREFNSLRPRPSCRYVMLKRVIRAAIHPLPNCRRPRLLPESH